MFARGWRAYPPASRERLQSELNLAPDAPPESLVAETAGSLRGAITNGEPQVTKGLLGALVERIDVEGRDAIQPVFRLDGVRTVSGSPPLPALLASRPSDPMVARVAKRRLIRRSRFPPVIQTLPQLLQQAREVHFVPLLHDLAVHDPVNVNPGSAQLLPRRRDTGELTFVLDAVGVVGHHLVALRDEEELVCAVKIESGEIGGEQLFECLAASDTSRGTDDMADVSTGMPLI